MWGVPQKQVRLSEKQERELESLRRELEKEGIDISFVTLAQMAVSFGLPQLKQKFSKEKK